MAGDIKHIVQQGDCLSKIAKHYGFTWQKIWDYGPNASLKAKRNNPNLIFPGDIVHIPTKEKKEESKAVDSKHKFKKKKELPTFQLKISFQGKPIKNLPARLTVASPTLPFDKQGTIDDQGFLKIDSSKDIRIAPDSSGGKLIVGNHMQLEYQLSFSHLTDHKTELGLKQRLFNLGFLKGSEPHNDTQVPKISVIWYRKMAQAGDSDQIDEPLKTQLKDTHGS